MVPKPREYTDKELKLEVQRLRGDNRALQSHVDALKDKLNRQKHEADQSRVDREQRDIDEHLELVKLRNALLQAAIDPSASAIRAGIKEQLPILDTMAAKRVQPTSRSSSPVHRVQKRKRASSVRDDLSSDDEEEVVTAKTRPYKRHSSPQVQIKRTLSAKPGPGRPRKSSRAKHPSSPTKYRGRGRPRKSDLDPADESSSGEDAPPSPSKRGRGRPRQNAQESDTDVNVIISPPRRKPGRPKKISMNGGNDDDAAPRKRGPGRPQKQPVEEEKSQGSDGEAKPAITRRFGPKKQTLEDGTSHGSDDDEIVAPPKRGRGRPKMSNGNPNPSTSGKSAAAPAKRGPGRPKKKTRTSTAVKAEAFDTQLGKFSEDEEIENGTLVWAKTPMRPWYPAVVFDENDPEVPVHILTGSTSKERHIVRLFNSTETWVCVPKIKLKTLGKFKELDQDMMASASHFQGQLTGGWTSDKRDEVLAAYQDATVQVAVESGDEGRDGPVVVQDADVDVAADSEDEHGQK
ncbi:hypothetical protein CPB85DRAFT_1311781 [Mucidula mucida]|nr:hypothetical protein CPB85DRAFT_1311781 [Mucidula mucida]